MAKFITFKSPSREEFKEAPLKSTWQLFQSLDKFTRIFIIIVIILSLVTPFIINNLQIFNPKAAPLTTTTELTGTVFLYYFPWYSSAPGYSHWLSIYHDTPPDNIGTTSYPKLGLYGTDDLAAVNQHFTWIKNAGVNVIVYDWWGQGKSDDLRLGTFLDRLNAFNIANGTNIKLAIMIDAYTGRNGDSVASDIRYIIDKYGNKPAFYRVNRSTKYGNNLKTSPRPLFFVYAAVSDTSNWPAAMDSIHNSSYDSIVLISGNDNLLIYETGSNNCEDGAGINSIQYESEAHHSDGVYAWAALYTGHCYIKTGSFPPKSTDYIAIHSVNPGYDDTRTRMPGRTLSRQDGVLYTNQWNKITSEKVEAVGISTFNEWLEGTQIEPAIPKSYSDSTGSYTYVDYTGDFETNLTGADIGMEYINATTNLAGLYKNAVAPVTQTGPQTLFAHYYGWYSGSPTWLHWAACTGCTPPTNVYSKFYPTLGAYDSMSDFVLDWHMQWLKFSKIDVILLSYWGRNDPFSSDAFVTKLLNKASANGLKVAFMLEPGPVEKHLDSITHIINDLTTNGTHPGLFKVVRQTKWGTNTNPRPLFTFYNWGQHYGINNPEMTADQIKILYRDLFRSLRNTPLDGIFLTDNSQQAMVLNPLNTPTDASARNDLDKFENDGLFSYKSDTTFWLGKTFAQSPDYLNMIQTAPGFDNTKIGGSKVIDRNNGQFYDDSWTEIANQKPEWAVVLTFNEWGENSQIEPASSTPPTAYPYLKYTGSFPTLPCVNDDARYLCATAKWAGLYKGAAATPTPTAVPTITPTPVPPGGPSPSCPLVSIPAYFDSSAIWSTGASFSPTVGVMIMNPNNGPGSVVDAAYQSIVNNAKSKGIKVLGYVYTGYGTRSTAIIKADIDKYKSWYGVSGIFFDEASDQAVNIPYYQDLANYTRGTAGTFVMLNPGVVPAEGYMSVGDTVVLFEDEYSKYLTATFPAWVNTYPASKIYHLVHNAPSTAAMQNALSLARARNAGYVYMTDDVLPNPWDILPTYFSSEISQIISSCSGITPTPTATPVPPTSTPTNTPTPVLPTSTVVPPTSTLIPTATPVISAADVNSDGCVGILDFNIWLTAFKTQTLTPGTFPDINQDGKINIVDYNIWFVTMKQPEPGVIICK